MFFPFVLFGQTEYISSKGKLGLTIDNEVILKAKYDSIVIKDDMIISAFKKNQLIYLNKKGDVIFKNKHGLKLPFENGFGPIQNKQGYWGVLNQKGDYIVNYKFSEVPIIYDNIIYLKNKGNSVFNQSGKALASEVSSVFRINEYFVFGFSTETRKVVSKKLFNKTINYVDLKVGYLFDSHKGTKIGSYRPFVKLIGDLFELSNLDKYKTLFSKTGTIILDGYDTIAPLDYGILEYSYRNVKGVHLVAAIDTLGKVVVPKNKYHRIEANDSIIYAFFSKKNSECNCLTERDIYDLSGSLLKSNVSVKTKITADMYIFKDSVGFYLGDKTGTSFSAYYSEVYEISDGMIRVQDGLNYGYIDLSQPKKKVTLYPMVFGTYYTWHKTDDRFLIFIYKRERRNNYGLIFSGSDFSNGYAPASLSAIDKMKEKDGSVMLDPKTLPKYNYIDHNGKFLSKTAYKECLPFINGRAWVKSNSYYYQIDTLGNAYKAIRALDVTYVDNGFYFIENKNGWGVMNDKFEMEVKCQYFFSPTFKDGVISVQENTNDIILYEFKD